MATKSDWKGSLVTWAAILGAAAALYKTSLGAAVEAKLTGMVKGSDGSTVSGSGTTPPGIIDLSDPAFAPAPVPKATTTTTPKATTTSPNPGVAQSSPISDIGVPYPVAGDNNASVSTDNGGSSAPSTIDSPPSYEVAATQAAETGGVVSWSENVGYGVSYEDLPYDQWF